MLGEVLEPQRSVALGREDSGHPAEGVIEIPEGDANAALNLDASTDDLGLLAWAADGQDAEKLTFL